MKGKKAALRACWNSESRIVTACLKSDPQATYVEGVGELDMTLPYKH